MSESSALSTRPATAIHQRVEGIGSQKWLGESKPLRGRGSILVMCTSSVLAGRKSRCASCTTTPDLSRWNAIVTSMYSSAIYNGSLEWHATEDDKLTLRMNGGYAPPDDGGKILRTFQTASFPLSHAWGPLLASPPNSTMTPSFDHSHQIPIEPDDGPAPPPFLSGSPITETKSLPVVVRLTSIVAGRGLSGISTRGMVKLSTGYAEYADLCRLVAPGFDGSTL